MALTRVKKVPTANLVQGSSFLTSSSSLAAANLTGTIIDARLPAGTVVQGFAQQSTGVSTTAGTTWLDTGSTITMTPKYSNSIIILNAMMAAEQYNAANTGSRYQIIRNKNSSDTEIYNSQYDLYHSNQSSSNQHIQKVTLVYNDPAVDTTERTYRIRFSSVTAGGTSRHNNYGEPSVFTILEVKQ